MTPSVSQHYTNHSAAAHGHGSQGAASESWRFSPPGGWLFHLSIPRGSQPGCHTGLYPLLSITHQNCYQISLFPCQKHLLTPAVTLRLSCWNPHPRLHFLAPKLLQQCLVRAPQQSPRQTKVYSKLSCRRAHPHLTLAAHHPHCQTSPLASG